MKEIDLQRQICEYISWKYPHFRFQSVGATDSRKASNLQSDRGFPDLMITNHTPFKYKAMFMEIKNGYDKVYTKKGCPVDEAGKLRTLLYHKPKKITEHLIEQVEYLIYLRRCGFVADLVCSFEHASYMLDRFAGGISPMQYHPVLFDKVVKILETRRNNESR